MEQTIPQHDITNGLTPEAREAIENALRQHEFYTNQRAFGPDFQEYRRKQKTTLFREYHKPFILLTNFGTIEVSPYYNETKKQLTYKFGVFVNNQSDDGSILKSLLNNGTN